MARLIVAGFALAALGLGAASCGGAAAYERGLLAKERMQMAPDPDTTRMERHVYEYREGSVGGYGTGGGGCGCN